MTNIWRLWEPHPPYWGNKNWLVARAMFTNHFSEQFFLVLLPCRPEENPTFDHTCWDSTRVPFAAYDFWWLLEAWEFLESSPTTPKTWTCWEIGFQLKLQLAYCIPQKYIHLALEWVIPPAHKQTCYSHLDKSWETISKVKKVRNPFLGNNGRSAIARSPWTPLSMTWYPDVEVARDGKSPLWAPGENETNSFNLLFWRYNMPHSSYRVTKCSYGRLGEE